jgi:hypothetical protein
MNFDDIPRGKAGHMNLGFFYYKSSLASEVTEFYLGRDGIIGKLDRAGEKVPGTYYLAADVYKQLNSFSSRLNYLSDPRCSVLHADLNKHNEKSDEGKVLNPATSEKLYGYAEDLSVRETRRQWARFEDEVHRVRGQAEGDRLLKQMKNISFSNSELRRLKYSIDGIITWLS